MKYTLQVLKSFKDKHDKSIKYQKGDTLEVTEERALELFSSDYGLVKFISREEIEQKELIPEVDKDLQDDPVEDPDQHPEIEDELDELNFRELQKLAQERNLDITGANSKEKLKELLRQNS